MKRKVLIFDCGFGEELIEKRIKERLPVDTERIIIRGGQNISDVVKEIEGKVQNRIGCVDVVVIAHPGLALMMLKNLKQRYLGQKFVGYNGEIDSHVVGAKGVLILAPVELRRTEQYQKMKVQCGVERVVEPSCERWLKAVSCKNKLTLPDLSGEIGAGIKVFVLQEKLLLRKKKIEKIVGWRGEVVDLTNKIVRDVGEQCGLTKWAN